MSLETNWEDKDLLLETRTLAANFKTVNNQLKNIDLYVVTVGQSSCGTSRGKNLAMYKEETSLITRPDQQRSELTTAGSVQ